MVFLFFVEVCIPCLTTGCAKYTRIYHMLLRRKRIKNSNLEYFTYHYSKQLDLPSTTLHISIPRAWQRSRRWRTPLKWLFSLIFFNSQVLFDQVDMVEYDNNDDSYGVLIVKIFFFVNIQSISFITGCRIYWFRRGQITNGNKKCMLSHLVLIW